MVRSLRAQRVCSSILLLCREALDAEEKRIQKELEEKEAEEEKLMEEEKQRILQVRAALSERWAASWAGAAP